MALTVLPEQATAWHGCLATLPEFGETDIGLDSVTEKWLVLLPGDGRKLEMTLTRQCVS